MIAIKNMKMPNSCDECPFYEETILGNNFFCYAKLIPIKNGYAIDKYIDINKSNVKREDCPLMDIGE